MLAAILALAAQRQFAVFAEREEKGIDRFRFAGSGKSRLAAVALTDPYRVDPREASRADRVDRLGL